MLWFYLLVYIFPKNTIMSSWLWTENVLLYAVASDLGQHQCSEYRFFLLYMFFYFLIVNVLFFIKLFFLFSLYFHIIQRFLFQFYLTFLFSAYPAVESESCDGVMTLWDFMNYTNHRNSTGQDTGVGSLSNSTSTLNC